MNLVWNVRLRPSRRRYQRSLPRTTLRAGRRGRVGHGPGVADPPRRGRCRRPRSEQERTHPARRDAVGRSGWRTSSTSRHSIVTWSRNAWIATSLAGTSSTGPNAIVASSGSANDIEPSCVETTRRQRVAQRLGHAGVDHERGPQRPGHLLADGESDGGDVEDRERLRRRRARRAAPGPCSTRRARCSPLRTLQHRSLLDHRDAHGVGPLASHRRCGDHRLVAQSVPGRGQVDQHQLVTGRDAAGVAQRSGVEGLGAGQLDHVDIGQRRPEHARRGERASPPRHRGRSTGADGVGAVPRGRSGVARRSGARPGCERPAASRWRSRRDPAVVGRPRRAQLLGREADHHRLGVQLDTAVVAAPADAPRP